MGSGVEERKENMEKINIINKSKEKINVEVSKKEGVIQCTINVTPTKRRLSLFRPGEVFSKNGTEYIVCTHFGNNGTAVIRKKCLEFGWGFGETNDWTESSLRFLLNHQYLNNLLDDFELDNILDHEVNLLSLDGYDDYGSTFDKVSVLTLDRFRRYHKIIGNVKQKQWLATPSSTPSGTGSSCVMSVYGNGGVDLCYTNNWEAARPFFILKSNILVEGRS